MTPFLFLVLFCGTPVSMTMFHPVPEGGMHLDYGPVAVEDRKFFLDLAKDLEANGIEVRRIKVEDQVQGITCGIST